MTRTLVWVGLLAAACGGEGTFMSDDVTALMGEVDEAFDDLDSDAVCDGMMRTSTALDEWVNASRGNFSGRAYQVFERFPRWNECSGLGEPSDLDLAAALEDWQRWKDYARKTTKMEVKSSKMLLYLAGLIGLGVLGWMIRRYKMT